MSTYKIVPGNKTKTLEFIFLYVLILAIASILSIFLIITFHMGEPVTMNLGCVLGFFLTILLLHSVLKHQNIYKINTKIKIQSGLIFATLVQLFLAAVSPLHTIVPENILLRMGILTPIYDDKDCETEKNFSAAQVFMDTNVDLKKVKIFYTKYFETFFNLTDKEDRVAATTWGNFIYLPSNNRCVTDVTLFHELVHVWQYQKGLGFGLEWNIKWIKYFLTYLKDFDSLYDFGGYEGLITAKENNKRFIDFELEQQAKMAELYYYVVTRSWPVTLENLQKSEGFNILNYFITQEFRFNIK